MVTDIQMKRLNQLIKACESKLNLFWCGVILVLLFWGIIILQSPIIHIRDFWTTPMQALITARSNCDSSLKCIFDFAQHTVHNDSVKLFPAVFELFHTSIFGYWSLWASRLLGAGCFVLTFAFLVKIHSAFFPASSLLSKALYLYWLFLLSMYIGIGRFSAPFAIHRSLPALCVVFSAYLLWAPLSNRLINKLRLPLLGLMSVISLFSFANGALLFFAVIAVTLFFKKFKESLYLSGLALISFSLYLLIVDFGHSDKWTQRADPSLGKGLSFFFDFTIYPVKKVFEDSPSLALFVSLLIVIAMGVYYKHMNTASRFNNDKNNNLASAFKFYSFILLIYSSVPILVTLQRGYTQTNDRYFIEAVMFNAALAGILFVIVITFNLHRMPLVFFLASICFVSLNMFKLSNLKQYWPGRYSANKTSTIECVQRVHIITPTVVERCGIPKEFGWWKHHKKRNNKIWMDNYSSGLNAVLNPKKQ